MTGWRSGNAAVCKTAMRGFDSRSGLTMFKNLTNFAYQRNKKEAVAFYLAYLVFIILLGATIQGILIRLSLFTLDFWIKIGSLMATSVCLFLCYKIIKSKNLFKSLNYLSLGLLSGLLSLSSWTILGLIIPAFLTTRKKGKLGS
ncbi:MAG: hypothetical protein ACD_52C00057G0008 [uncultured bacterium]|nr:MAG: hypothetical protein ACD_52C00057G0008 [uncultured bacterium]